MRNLTQDVKRKAIEIGFSKVGISRAVPLEEEKRRLAEWLQRGFHASMHWMERDPSRRANPLEVLQGARSIISVAMNYYTPTPHSESKEKGKISRYAWGDDYHEIVGEKLKILEAFLNEEAPDCATRSYVDTGPVMEKAWAARSGIGWLGKHTNVITRDFGSWVFLGEVVTTLPLDEDAPAEDLCGTCTACIEACPTDAIVQPYVLDSEKCISYGTIEHRGELPEHIAGNLHNWIFGCDICQDVCPWNRFQRPTRDSGFHARPENIDPHLDELFQMTQEEFSKRFRGSPVKRAKVNGLARNAKDALDSNVS